MHLPSSCKVQTSEFRAWELGVYRISTQDLRGLGSKVLGFGVTSFVGFRASQAHAVDGLGLRALGVGFGL